MRTGTCSRTPRTAKFGSLIADLSAVPARIFNLICLLKKNGLINTKNAWSYKIH